MIFQRSDESEVSLQACAYIKKHKAELLENFANDSICMPKAEPGTVIMAGSPGAGKTETSKRLISQHDLEVVRVDADEIRVWLPQYEIGNGVELQKASTIGVNRLVNYVYDKKKHLFLDGTFASFNSSEENVKRSLKRGRETVILYLYQDPIIAWQFTRAREGMDGRVMPKENFIEAFFAAKDNVNKVKEMHPKVKVHLIVKNFANETESSYFNIDKIDNYIKLGYNEEQLIKIL